MNVKEELKDMFWRLEFPFTGDKIKDDTVTKEDVISAVKNFTSNDMQHVIVKVDEYVDKLEADRDRYKTQAERYRKALIKIRGDGQGAIWQDIVREIDAALEGD